MRIPLGIDLESRDGSVSRDAKVLNGAIEIHGEGDLRVRMRPGSVDLGLVKAGTAQLLYNWNGIKAILADTLNAFTLATVTTPVQTAISPTAASQSFSAEDNGSNSTTPLLMLQNGLQAWSVNQAGALSAITLPAALGSHVVSITSLTRVGTTATALTATDPLFDVGQSITIAGATPIAYNGAQVVTAATPSSFTPAANIPITVTRLGTTATATTVSGPHGLTNGSSYTIAGADQAAYNGSFVVTVTSDTTFTFTVSTSGGSSGITGTWNPSDKDAHVALSGGNLVASIAPAIGTRSAVRGTVGKSTGSWYWEVTVTSAFVTSIGVANSTFPLTDYVGQDSNSWGYASGRLYSAGVGPVVASYTTGDVIGVSLNMTAGTVTFYKNGIQQGSFSGLTGTIYPTVSNSSDTTSTAAVLTGNFGAGAFVYDDKSPATPATGVIAVTVAAVTVPASFTFTIGGSPATPATGTITGSYSKQLVPGIAYLDGTFYVMDETGVIFNTTVAADDPTSFPALGFITAQSENGGGKALKKSGSNVVAFKEWSTEFFYNASNATGSPLSPIQNGFTKVGCASGASVAELDDDLFWISQGKKGGRGIHRMEGLQQQKISTPDVDRILSVDSLSTVHAFGLRLDGHGFYVLTLVSSNITIVYDLTSQRWSQWSSYTVSAVPSVTSITRSGNTATVVTPVAHGLSDGDPVLISGASQPSYNGIHQMRYISPTIFTIEVLFEPTTPATGTIIFGRLAESYFKFTKHMSDGAEDLLLHESDGHLYLFDSSQLTDAGIPISLFTRTGELDGGSMRRKKMSSLGIVAEKLDALMMVRFSDDDGETFSAYRIVALGIPRPLIRKCGGFHKRIIETRYISGRYLANSAPHLAALELEIAQ